MEKIWANSGDSHYLESDTFWSDCLPPALAERMPRSVRDEDGRHETIHVDGRSFQRTIPSVDRKKDEDGLTMLERNQTRRPGITDMEQRLADLDQEGVWGEIAYPSLGIWLALLTDPDLVREAVRGCNDWIASEVMGRSPRLVFPAQVSMLRVEDAIEETQRAAGLGYRAIFLPNKPQDGVPDLNDESWKPLWAAAEEAGMVLTFHIGFEPADLVAHRGPGGAVMNWIEASWGGQRAAFKLVSCGALDQHPGLKVLISEGGASWVPFLGDRMDEAYRQLGTFVRPKLSLTPKELLYRQVYASFQHDETAVAALTAMGYRNVVWGSDYPHVEGTYGHTQETLHGLFDDQPDDVRRRITIESFLELFPDVGTPPVGAEELVDATGR